MKASLRAIHRDLRLSSISAAQLTEPCLEQMEQSETWFNAYKTPLPDNARETAAQTDARLKAGDDPGPLAGIPVSVKDLYAVHDVPLFAGSASEIPQSLLQQGPVVNRLRNQGAVITGKTHTVEFAFGGLGFNSHWGTPRNPWDASEHRVPGGSSSGAGVSLCQGSALLALGTDTAGSVRIPASMTGNVGLKTSFGRWSLDGIFPLSPSLDTAGLLTRTVEDAAFAFAALDPLTTEPVEAFLEGLPSTTAPRLGLGEPALWDHCEDHIVDVVQGALEELARDGASFVDTTLPEVSDAQELLRQGNVVAAELAEFLSAMLPAWLDKLDPVVGSRIRDGGSISAAEWLGRKRRLDTISATASRHFEACDVIVSPTVPISPPRVDDVAEIDQYRPANLASLSNTCVANSLRLCALTLPVGLDKNGMPVGLQIMAPHGEENRLLGVGLWLENKLGNRRERIGNPPEAA